MKTKTPIKIMKTIKVQMLAGRTAEIKFSDSKQAREYFDFLRNTGILAGEAIRVIDLE
jgi:hypothetical protein